jgi:hypothetical protein
MRLYEVPEIRATRLPAHGRRIFGDRATRLIKPKSDRGFSRWPNNMSVSPTGSPPGAAVPNAAGREIAAAYHHNVAR